MIHMAKHRGDGEPLTFLMLKWLSTLTLPFVTSHILYY